MGKLIFTKKCYLLEDIDFYEKWPPEPIKRLVILGISDIGGKYVLYVKKLIFKLETHISKEKLEVLELLFISWEFSNIFKPTGAEKCDLCILH